MEYIVCETIKVNISKLPRGLQTARTFIEQWFKKPPLVNKNLHLF